MGLIASRRFKLIVACPKFPKTAFFRARRFQFTESPLITIRTTAG
jgi:hypothetical protein